MTAVKKCLESQKLPTSEQPESAKKSVVMSDLSAMFEELELAEGQIRDMAVRSMENGLETTTDDLAKHFEKMMRDLTQMDIQSNQTRQLHCISYR